jgi:hypothetical protein
MAKRTAKIDVVPFVPSASPVCRLAETALLFSGALAGFAAALLTFIQQVTS